MFSFHALLLRFFIILFDDILFCSSFHIEYVFLLSFLWFSHFRDAASSDSSSACSRWVDALLQSSDILIFLLIFLRHAFPCCWCFFIFQSAVFAFTPTTGWRRRLLFIAASRCHENIEIRFRLSAPLKKAVFAFIFSAFSPLLPSFPASPCRIFSAAFRFRFAARAATPGLRRRHAASLLSAFLHFFDADCAIWHHFRHSIIERFRYAAYAAATRCAAYCADVYRRITIFFPCRRPPAASLPPFFLLHSSFLRRFLRFSALHFISRCATDSFRHFFIFSHSASSFFILADFSYQPAAYAERTIYLDITELIFLITFSLIWCLLQYIWESQTDSFISFLCFDASSTLP